MFKKVVFLLIVFIALSYVTAQEQESTPQNELRLKYLSSAGPIQLNLTKYLGSAEDSVYIFSAPDSIEVRIDQTTGIANVKGISGWSGSEVVIFKLNKTAQQIFFEESGIIQKEVAKVSNADLVRLFNYGVAQDSFDSLSKNIKQEIIKNLQTKLEHDKLLVLINKDIEISATVSNIPEVSIDILIRNFTESKLVVKNQKEGYFDSVVSFFAYLLFFIFLLFSTAYLFRRLPGGKHKLKSIQLSHTLIDKLTKIENSSDADRSRALMLVINEFFMRYFYVSLNSSLFELKNELDRQGIGGNLKQEIMSLFEESKFGVEQGEVRKAISKLKSIIRRLG